MTAPVLIYDGDCPFCHGAVRWVLRHERRHDLLFAPRGGATARALLAGRPDLDDVDSVMWVDRDPDGRPIRVLVRSAAALRVCGYLGGIWGLLRAFWIVPRPWRDAVYDLIARRRRQILGGQVCGLPAPEMHARFLDHG